MFNNKQHITNKEKPLIKSIAIQTIIFVCIFQFTSFIRETNMLARNTEITQTRELSTIASGPVNIMATEKPLVLYFFAPWCQVCHASISNLQSIYEKHENLDVIAVALDFDNREEVERFTRQHKLTFPVALGDSMLKNDFQVPGYPSYYVLNEQNIIISKSMGYSTELGIYLRSL